MFTVLHFQIVMVSNNVTGKPRGYAFIEYEHERDMHCKYTSLLSFSKYHDITVGQGCPTSQLQLTS